MGKLKKPTALLTLEEGAEWLQSRVLEMPREPDKVALATAYRELYGKKTRLALKHINREFGTRYNVKRYREWERGVVKMPHNIKDFLRREVIKSRFGPAAARALMQLLSIPDAGDDLI